MHCSALPEGPLVAKDLREETLGATILVTAVTELPLQLPPAQKKYWNTTFAQRTLPQSRLSCVKDLISVSPF